MTHKVKFFFVGSGGGGGGGYGITISPTLSPYYMLGVLNSRLLDWFVKRLTTPFHSGWYAYNKQYIEQIPIKCPETAQERKFADQIIERVERIIEAKKQLQKGSSGNRVVERWHREIESREHQIDELVCRLYGVDEIPDTD